MTLRPIGIVTCAGLPDLDHDGPALTAALATVGLQAVPVVWDDAAVDWAAFDLLVVRSPWDYIAKRDAFLAWLAQVAQTVPVTNPPEVIRWNIDKTYLRTLQEAGVPVTPTYWPEGVMEGLDDYVVKPTMSAGCLDTARFGPGEQEQAAALMAAIRKSGRLPMVQEYVPSVDVHGETALLFFGGEYSHAIRKAGMLTHSQGLEKALFRPENIEARVATAAERETAQAVLDAVPFPREALTYARVDLVLDAAGEPMVLELELFEPSIFLGYDERAADRVAAAIAAHPALA